MCLQESHGHLDCAQLKGEKRRYEHLKKMKENMKIELKQTKV